MASGAAAGRDHVWSSSCGFLLQCTESNLLTSTLALYVVRAAVRSATAACVAYKMASDELEAEIGLLEAMYADDAQAAFSVQRDATSVTLRLSLQLPPPSSQSLALLLTALHAYPSDGQAVQVSVSDAQRLDDAALQRWTRQLTTRARELADAHEPALVALIEEAKVQLEALTVSSAGCLICLQTVAAADAHIPATCGHTFHAACLFTWLAYRVQQHEQSQAVADARAHARAIVSTARSAVTTCSHSVDALVARMSDVDAEMATCMSTVDTYAKQQSMAVPPALPKASAGGKGKKAAPPKTAAAASISATVTPEDIITLDQCNACTTRITALNALRLSLVREHSQYTTKLQLAREELSRVEGAQSGLLSADIAVLAPGASLDCPSCRAPLPSASSAAFVTFARSIVRGTAAVSTADVIAALQPDASSGATVELDRSTQAYVEATRRRHAELSVAQSALAVGTMTS